MGEKANEESVNPSAVKARSGRPQRRRLPKKPSPRLLPPWKLLLHNDDKNVFEDVVRVICRLTPLKEQEALTRTLEAHETGVAMLLVTHKERAELYVEQFASCALTVTAEPEA